VTVIKVFVFCFLMFYLLT
jgi:hypothetical protein